MEILNFEAIVDGVLYAVHWKEDGSDCFSKMLAQLDDAEYLHKFFSAKLPQAFSGYYDYQEIDEFIDDIQNELQELTEEIMELAEKSLLKERDYLLSIFQPYHDGDKSMSYVLSKAKADVRKPILRIYGCRIPETGCMVITGFGIKLTRATQDDKDLIEQHEKMKFTKNYIEEIKFTG